MTSDDPRRFGGAARPDDAAETLDPAADDLDRYWDALTGHGFRAPDRAAIAFDRMATIDRLHTLADHGLTRIPDATRSRIWRTTVAVAGIPTEQESAMLPTRFAGDAAGPSTTGNGRLVALPPAGAPPTPPRRRSLEGGSWWSRLQFAAVAVLVLGLFAIAVAPYRDSDNGLFGGVDATRTVATPDMQLPPSGTFGSGQVVPVPQSETGHVLRIDRVTIPADERLELPANAIHQFSVMDGTATLQQTGEQPTTISNIAAGIVGLAGGAVTADEGDDVVAIVTSLVSSGAPGLVGDSIVVMPLASHETRVLQSESTATMYAGSGEIEPRAAAVEPVPTGGVGRADPLNLTSGGAIALLYADAGSVRIRSDYPSIFDPADPLFYLDQTDDLTITGGQAAVIHDPAYATVQSEIPDLEATYLVAAIAPPGIDRTVGRTYPNTRTGVAIGELRVPVPDAAAPVRVQLDRVTLLAGQTLSVTGNAPRLVTWTGGDPVSVDGYVLGLNPGTVNPPIDQPFDLTDGFVAEVGGNVATTFLVATLLPDGAMDAESADLFPDEIPSGVESDRLGIFDGPDALTSGEVDNVRVALWAQPASSTPIAIDPATGADATLRPGLAVAIVRVEEGAIRLDRPAQALGADGSEFAAGDVIPAGTTVRVEGTFGGTIEGVSELSGYTLLSLVGASQPYFPGQTDSTPVDDREASPEATPEAWR